MKIKLIIGTLVVCIIVLSGLLLNQMKSGGAVKTPPSGKFIFFAGGTPDFFFSATVAKGAQMAALDLGVDVEIYWSNWDTKKMVVQFKAAIDKKPDGIAVMGHPGEKALGLLINEAIRKGIIVTSLNTPLPQSEEKYMDSGFGYVGQDIYLSGLNLAKAAFSKFNLKSGDKVIFFGTESIPVRGLRSTSARNFFQDKGLEVIYIENVVLEDYQAGNQWQIEKLNNLLKEHPDTDLIFDDNNVSASVVALKDAGYMPGTYPLVGFDLSPELLDDLGKGYIDILSDQQPFLQGYLSILQLAFTHRWHFSGLNINTGSGLVTSSTVYDIEKFVKQGIR